MSFVRKNIVITGANVGIGFQTAKALFSDHHHIIFGSRNQDKNNEAVKRIVSSCPKSIGTIKSHRLDLSQKSSVEEFANFTKSHFQHIDILINNAGMIMNTRRLNEMGVEMMMAVNHFGHFYLTYLLFPLIKASQEARIINVSSRAHTRSSLCPAQDITSSQNFGSMRDYQKSKLANVQFTVGLADRLSKFPHIKTASLHPGVVASQFGNSFGPNLVKLVHFLCGCFFISNQDGAKTTLHLSRVDFDELKSGQYYHNDCKIRKMNALGRDRMQIDKLWRTGQKLYGIQFII